MSSRSARLSRTESARPISAKPLASRLLSAEDQAPVDDLAGCGIFDLIQADVHSELAAELDFDVANVAWLVNSPGDRADSQRGQNGQRREARTWRGFGAMGGSWETSLAPSLLLRSDRRAGTGGSWRARIDELAVSLNYTFVFMTGISPRRCDGVRSHVSTRLGRIAPVGQPLAVELVQGGHGGPDRLEAGADVFLDDGRGDLEGDDVFDDHAGGRHGADVGAFVSGGLGRPWWPC